MIINKCDNCEKDFETKLKTTKYCSKECYYKYLHNNSHEKSNCLFCDKEFEYLKTSNRKYCSSDCQQKQRTKDSVVETTCNYCGKSYFSKTFEHNNFLSGKKKYECCSSICSNRIIAENNKGDKNNLYNHIEKICENCGANYSIKNSVKETSKFCSRKCQGEHKTQNSLLELICVGCNKTFSKKKGDSDAIGIIKYCSKKCRVKAMDKRVTLVCSICGKNYKLPICYSKKSVACSNKCKNVWLKQYSNLPETIERLRRQGTNSQLKMKTKYTLPEMITMKYLLDNNISFTPQFSIGGILIADFFLYDYNCVLEVYGDYWHCNPEVYGENKKSINEMQIKTKNKDKRRYYVITKKYKYYFYNIWEKDIKKNIDETMEKFFKHINLKIRNESVVK